MTTPVHRKPSAGAPSAAEPVIDVIPILVAQKVLTAEQAERVQRAVKVNSLPREQAIIQMGFANEVQIAKALAAHAGLPYVKINPLDLDLDVVKIGRASCRERV